MNNRVIMVFVGVFALIFALVLGNKVATQDYETMVAYVGVALGIFYLTKLYKYSFAIVLFIALSGVSMSLPIGSVDGAYMALGVFGMTASYELFRASPKKVFVQTWKSPVALYFFAIGVIGLLYIYQVANPVNPYEFSSKQTFKAMFGLLGPYIILSFWCIKSDAYVFRMSSRKTVLYILLFSMIFHVVFRFYLMGVGVLSADEDGAASEAAGASYNLIGGLSASPFILRSVGPTAVAVGAFSALEWLSKSKNHNERSFMISLSLGVVFIGLLGSLLSAGRGAVLLSFTALIVAAVYYRRYIAVMAAGFSFILLVALINIFSSVMVDYLPATVSRTLTMLVISDTSSSSSSVESSTNWREELAEMAYDEWTSSADLFIRGRGVYEFNYLDTLATDIVGGYEGVLISSLKTGNAHTLLLTIALKFGLIAVLLNYILHLYLCVKGGVGVYIDRRKAHAELPSLFVVSIYLLCISFVLSFVSMTGVSLFFLLCLLASTRQMALDSADADELNQG